MKLVYSVGLCVGMLFSSFGCTKEKTYCVNRVNVDRVEIRTRGEETSAMFFDNDGNYRGHFNVRGECKFRFKGGDSEIVGGNAAR
ncbi:MAG: hypothetical protein KKF56_01630 [Nanoarchaeota archaeon]|nr:hypothetical protein [Nanoarchaeota archaeon]